MELGLGGKTVLITGGSRGIGFACAQAFLAEGARVAICSRNPAHVDAALVDLPTAAGFTADLTDAAQATAMLADVQATIGPVDVLVNSAGAAKRVAPEELTPALWRAALDAKFFSYINVIDPVVKSMAARGSGVIVNIIGNGGKVANPVHIAGGAANAALMLATAGLAAAYGRQSVRVVGLNPGITATGRVTGFIETKAQREGISTEQALERAVADIGLGRMAEPADIANMAVFLASEKAGYVSGVTIGMDGVATPVI
ncbi:SDR family NAD(P)-dependent oxidoreductase [Acidocella aromatica]|uniref:NAD(P)-dependent dehydrogenase (Short-subunit alcohol dehydrogenase family) n=1 Tax=Acidocella aromatica TaxID=1303579 RepID=A0A840VD97_9PROT|nr:SDR family NAD(P)-dependent oxidoreductase [Acidocella aromatica]MBB5373676.1 NAD(P)-dependent dehydrogenase (short-subunit alcohol dehydrogenase family) [Acidocella aromatica]